MRLAIVAAGFTPGEADQLRRAWGPGGARERSPSIRDKFRAGLLRTWLPRGIRRADLRADQGFGEYGFPESHAASFAILVYVSAWLKCHYPAAFTAALINSQPMGFYAPAQLTYDAQAHGVPLRPIDINQSDWDCTLDPANPAGLANHPSPFRFSAAERLGHGTQRRPLLKPARQEVAVSLPSADVARRGHAFLKTLAAAPGSRRRLWLDRPGCRGAAPWKVTRYRRRFTPLRRAGG